MAMETALLGCALPLVIQKLQEMLILKGFRVQTVTDRTTIILAYQDGNWFRKPKQVVLELSPVDDAITRVDVTAIIETKKKDPEAEEVIEERIVSTIYQNFKPTIETRYGI